MSIELKSTFASINSLYIKLDYLVIAPGTQILNEIKQFNTEKGSTFIVKPFSRLNKLALTNIKTNEMFNRIAHNTKDKAVSSGCPRLLRLQVVLITL